MSDLLPSEHAQFGCEYLDELVQALQRQQWCFHETYGIERRVSEHAEALGLPAPLDRPSKPEHETPQELEIWLEMHDRVTGSRQVRLISRLLFAPPPAEPRTVLKTLYRPLDERERAGFCLFVDHVKRELCRRGRITNGLGGEGHVEHAPNQSPDGYYSPTDIARAMGVPRKRDAIRMALNRLFEENRLPDGAWMENNNPAKGQAHILYRLSSVRPHLARFEKSDPA
jgi:hypothetical protein